MMIYLLVLFLCIHTAYYIILYSKLMFYKPEDSVNRKSKGRLSILTCYYNEESLAEQSVQLLKAQKTPIIAIDDNSVDQTWKVLSRNLEPPHQLLRIDESSFGKKNALHKGIRTSRTNRILLTDADCIPASEKWASKMNFSDSAFVLGYAPMVKRKSIITLFSRYETYITAMQYLSYALHGMPYMGVGRNMRIDKKLYLEKREIIQGNQLASGDDDLMVSALANEENTSICIDPEAFVYSESQSTWRSFFRQKARHISTSPYYRPIIKRLLFCFSASHIAVYLVAILGMISGTIPFELVIIAIGLKWLIQCMVGYPIMKKLKEEDLFLSIPFLDVLHLIYLLIVPFVYLNLKNKNHWN